MNLKRGILKFLLLMIFVFYWQIIVYAGENNKPTSEDFQKYVSKTKGYAFKQEDFLFKDSDEISSLSKIKITSVPGESKGAFTFESSGVTINQEINTEDLSRLKYTPGKEAKPGEEYASFKFKVSDGTDYSDNEYTCTLKINTPPVITSSPVLSILENNFYSYEPSGSDDDEGQELKFKLKPGSDPLPDWLTFKDQWTGKTFAGQYYKKGYSGDGGQASLAKLNRPQGICEDYQGNIYITDDGNHVIRKIDKDGIISTFAGTGEKGTSTEGTIAKNAKLGRLLYGIACDKKGNLYFHNIYEGEHTIKKITKEGKLETFASLSGYCSTFFIDDSNNLYTSLYFKNIIIKIDPTGKTTETIAGSNTGELYQENISAVNANLNTPFSVCKDSIGNIYFTESKGHIVRKIDSKGYIHTIVGKPDKNGDTDFNGPGLNAVLSSPEFMTIDSLDNLYFSCPYISKIKKINTKNNLLTSLAHFPKSGNNPYSLLYRKKNGLLAVCINSQIILKVNKPCLTGTPKSKDIGKCNTTLILTDGIDETEQKFTITVKPLNNLPTSKNINLITGKKKGRSFSKSDFPFTDSDEGDFLSKIKITSVPGESKGAFTFESSGVTKRVEIDQEINSEDLSRLKYIPGKDAKPGEEYASFKFKVSDGKNYSSAEYICKFLINSSPVINSKPILSIKEGEDYLYNLKALDKDNDDLTWKINPLKPLPEWLLLKTSYGAKVIAGKSGELGYSGDGVNALDARFNWPAGLCGDKEGNLYISSQNKYVIRKIDKNGIITTIAGVPGEQGVPVDGQPAKGQKLESIVKLHCDEKGSLYFFSGKQKKVKKIDSYGIISSVSDEVGLQNPKSADIFIDKNDNIYLTDYYYNLILKIDKSRNKTIIAGKKSSMGGFSGDGGKAVDAKFKWPLSVIADDDGSIYIADNKNNRIRKVDKKGVITTIAGTGEKGSEDGALSEATLSKPEDMYMDSSQNIYFLQGLSKSLRKLDLKTNKITTLTKDFKNPSSIFCDKNDDVFITDLGDSTIKKLIKNFSLAGTSEKGGDYEISLILSDGFNEVEHNFTITVKAKSKPVDPTPPSPSEPSEPEEENDLGIDSSDNNYEETLNKYQRSIKGTGSISGFIKVSGDSKKVKFTCDPLKGLALNNNGSYTFDSSGYKGLKKGETKVVTTSAVITDEKGNTFNFTIEIEVSGENDAPEIGKINNIIKYKNFDEVVIPVQVNDPDNNTNELVFSLEVKDPSIAEISLENNNQLRIVSEPGISGTTGISLKVSDGEKTSVMTFKLKVLSMEDGDNVDEAGDVEVEVEGDVTKTKVKVPEDGIEIETKEDESTGNVEYDLDHNNKNSHAKSEIKGSKVEISNKGAEIIYEEEDLELKVSSTITGETRGQITKNGKTTEFISKIPGGDTKIGEKDSRVEIETDLKVWETKEIKAVVGEDGSFKEEVTVNGKTTKISTKVPGSKTILDENESLKTNLEMNKGSDGNIRKINAVAVTDPKGESLTWFEENGKVLERTISEKTPLETGSEIEIIQNGSEVEFKIRTELTRELIIEEVKK